MNRFGDRLAPDGTSVQENFDRWFAGSAVVDAAGAPLRVFHATWYDFDSFEQSEDIGFHFGSAAAANKRVQDWMDGETFSEDSHLMPVYLLIRNPLRLPDLHTWASTSVAGALFAADMVTAEEHDELCSYNDVDLVERILAAKGYDGIVYDNVTEGGGDSFIVFDARRIKSAIGNSGLFDPNCEDLTDRRQVNAPAERVAERAGA